MAAATAKMEDAALVAVGYEREVSVPEAAAASRLLATLLQCWREQGTKTALQLKEGDALLSFSYRELLPLSQALALRLPRGRRRIGILCESRPEFVLSLFAAFQAGVTLVVLDPALTEWELARLVKHSQIELLLTSNRHASRARLIAAGVRVLELQPYFESRRHQPPPASGLLPPPDVTAPLLMIYSSGTTGGAKAIMIAACSLLYQAAANAERVALRAQDRVLSILPLNHLYELSAGTLTPLFVGATVTYAGTLLPDEVVRLMQEQRTTMMVGVPIFFKAVKRALELQSQSLPWAQRLGLRLILRLAPYLPRPLRRLTPVHRRLGGHLRQLISGGAALPTAVQAFFAGIGSPVLQGYGLSEASPVIACTSAEDNRLGSCGKALPGTEIRIETPDAAGVGEIMVRGPQLMLGYWNQAEAEASALDPAGWLRTGDLGYLDRDGFLYVTGRSRNLIVLGGGKKVYPEEIEARLGELPEVLEFCVTGVRSGDWEEVALVCVPSASLWQRCRGDGAAVKAEVAKVLRRSLQLAGVADFKCPRRVLLSAQPLPKTSTQKVRLRELAARIEQGEIA